MSFTLLSDKLIEIAKELDDKMPDIIASASMAELMAIHKERIFDKGEKSDGSKIGDYSTTPIYVDKSSFIRKNAFKGVGKKDKNGNQRKGNKTMYIPGGYSEFRTLNGRQNSHINFKFSGSLEAGLRIYKFGSEVLYGNNDEDETKKIEGLTDKFGKTFELSNFEEEFLKNDIPERASAIVNTVI